MKVKIKKIHPDATLPRYVHPGDAGMDIYCTEDFSLAPGERYATPTGLAFEIPEGYVGLIWEKSGLAFMHGITTYGGVIDSGYRGELKVGLINVSDETYHFKSRDKITQMLIQKVQIPEIVEVNELSESIRGEGGFGSTGKK